MSAVNSCPYFYYIFGGGGASGLVVVFCVLSESHSIVFLGLATIRTNNMYAHTHQVN